MKHLEVIREMIISDCIDDEEEAERVILASFLIS